VQNLEKLVEDLSLELVHGEFRLWLTTASDERFPVSILQNGIKMTVETSGDVKQMMLNAYAHYSNDFEECQNINYRALLFSTTLFHALLIDRKKFGSIGWNCTYDFSNEDLFISKDQLLLLLGDENKDNKIQYKVVQFLLATINYGGRITDDKDERFIKSFVQIFINPDFIKNREKYSFDSKGK